MRSMSRIALGSALATSAVALWACTIAGPGDLGMGEESLIYGTDNRYDAWNAPPEAQTLLDSEVMLLRSNLLVPAGDGYDIAYTRTYDQYIQGRYGMPLCEDEPYRDQVEPGFCSGFMVAEDVIATAGHCVTTSRDCRTTSFVFGFQVPAEGSPAVTHVPASNVYQCTAIIDRVETSTNDWGLIRVDRRIVGHSPLAVRGEGAVGDGAQLAVIGHPLGLPVKYADGASVMDNTPTLYFQSNLDVYGGNSGSAVVSFVGGVPLVEGILVRGNPDFAQGVDSSGLPCMRSAHCDDTGCTGSSGTTWEEVTRATNFAALIPGPVVCGDGVCSDTEGCTTCEADCGPCPYCGDGVCNGTDTPLACPEDCALLPRGAACTSGGECQSGVCHPKRHVCR